MPKIKITWEEDGTGKTKEKEYRISGDIDNMKVYNICKKFFTENCRLEIEAQKAGIYKMKVKSKEACDELIEKLSYVPHIGSQKNTQDLVSPGSLKKILEQFPGAGDSRKSPTTPKTAPQSPDRWIDRGPTGTEPQPSSPPTPPTPPTPGKKSP